MLDKKLTISLRVALLLSFTNIASAATEEQQNQYFCGDSVPAESRQLTQITSELYQIVSGDAGQQKNWSLMKELFAKNAIVTPVFHRENGLPHAESLTVDQFIALNKKIFNSINFYETEVAQQVNEFGHMATILSQYESRDQIDAAPYSTGVNSFQLLNDGRRWCVISVTWDSDKGNHPKKLFNIKS